MLMFIYFNIRASTFKFIIYFSFFILYIKIITQFLGIHKYYLLSRSLYFNFYTRKNPFYLQKKQKTVCSICKKVINVNIINCYLCVRQSKGFDVSVAYPEGLVFWITYKLFGT